MASAPLPDATPARMQRAHKLIVQLAPALGEQYLVYVLELLGLDIYAHQNDDGHLVLRDELTDLQTVALAAAMAAFHEQLKAIKAI